MTKFIIYINMMLWLSGLRQWFAKPWGFPSGVRISQASFLFFASKQYIQFFQIRKFHNLY